ncbi:MAG: methyltransferase domain-containing protein [Candidatus Nitrotoga sp.]|nr:methyltransferase domain-containing protein [Candidatus Nitrotoga sp.]
MFDDEGGSKGGGTPSFKRSRLEQLCFAAGYRKHPAYYKGVDYESLNNDIRPIFIPMERIPSVALAEYPLSSLEEERGLHMDMTRDSGERSDAHIIRYQWACNYIKPGDRVLDAACGLGYGGHVVRHLTAAAKVVGIDGSDFAIDYARKAFPCAEERAEYRVGMLPADLTEFPDGSFEVIISFETLEHVEQPQQLLQEFYRLLTPGGRVVVSVPNDWSDETGEDPNPFHLHVYDWNKLKSELAAHFILENAFAQTASQCKVAEKGGVWERRPRSLKQVALSEHPPEDCEWWLMTAMKSPLECTSPYEERVFANIATSGHPSIRYSEFFVNPWLMNAMVNLGCRLKNDEALEDIALAAMTISPNSTNDYAAALCVMAYRILDRCFQDSAAAEEIISKIDVVTANPPSGPMGLRWKVSLLFIKAKLLQTLGYLEQAKMTFVECASHDVRCFGIHLATKTTEAWFIAGRLAYAIGDLKEARSCWERGVESGAVLLSVSIDDILINRSFPNRFNHGDGVREYTISWDNIARCANGLHLLKQGKQFDYTALDNCFQTEYSTVTRDLLSCRSQLLGQTEELVETRQTLVERTALLEQANEDLRKRTEDLMNIRQTLVKRTARLEQSNADLLDRTRDLVETRQTLVERTALLEQANKILRERTK